MARTERYTRWKRDPIAFVAEVLRDPETGRPFVLYEAQERFLRKALTPTAEGKLPFPELLYSCPKKSGKTATAAMAVIYVVVVLGGPYAEGIVCANDFEQAQSRVFQAIARIIETSPLLKDGAKITANRIEFTSTGATIIAIANDYAGAAGANPTIVAFDELWAYTSERSQRLWDELIPVPTRKVSVRLTTTYAGFEGESELLEGLYKRGVAGTEIAPALYESEGLLCFWSQRPVAPWQDEKWLADSRRALRPNAYLRLIENQWVTSESSFVDMQWWDQCTDPDLHPELADPRLSIWVGVDASTKRDSTAIVCCTYDHELKKVRLAWHRIFQPSPDDPLQFEETIEKTLLDMRRRFNIREVRFDPYQMQAVAQRLKAAGLPMVEFQQSVPNLTESSTTLYELIKGRNLAVYEDADLRLSISRSVARESSRGWILTKEKSSHKIDVVVALAMAALGAVQQGQAKAEYSWTPVRTLRTLAGSPMDSYTSVSRGGDNVMTRMDALDAAESQSRLSRRWRSGRGLRWLN